ncbi:hypothetical protein HMI55_003884, partial [Coelomomyces lativittatus]
FLLIFIFSLQLVTEQSNCAAVKLADAFITDNEINFIEKKINFGVVELLNGGGDTHEAACDRGKSANAFQPCEFPSKSLYFPGYLTFSGEYRQTVHFRGGFSALADSKRFVYCQRKNVLVTEESLFERLKYAVVKVSETFSLEKFKKFETNIFLRNHGGDPTGSTPSLKNEYVDKINKILGSVSVLKSVLEEADISANKSEFSPEINQLKEDIKNLDSFIVNKPMFTSLEMQTAQSSFLNFKKKYFTPNMAPKDIVKGTNDPRYYLRLMYSTIQEYENSDKNLDWRIRPIVRCNAV